MHLKKILIPVIALLAIVFVGAGNSGCGVYSFRDVSIPDSMKSAFVEPFVNRASYVNPQLAQNLTERFRRKIQNQTRMRLLNDDRADLVIRANIIDYSVTTSGVTTTGSSLNRLTVTVQVTVTNTRNAQAGPSEFTVSRPFDFAATSSLQQAEAALFDEILRGLSDDIFNRVFSNW